VHLHWYETHGLLTLNPSCNLIRFGINAEIIDNRSDKTTTGRADGLQPKTIETLKQMRLADRLLLKAVKVYDINIWQSTPEQSLQRVGKEVHFPPSLDCLDPYLLLAHQGFVEDVFLKDIMERGVGVKRNLTFVDYQSVPGSTNPLEVICKSSESQAKRVLTTRYLVGCDGSHSNVRKAIGARTVGSTHDAVWGVIDGVLETNFPDIYSKTVIHNADIGSVLLFPRERNMTRLYIELKSELREGIRRDELDQEFVIRLAEEVFEPYYFRWKSVEWFGRYQIGQKIASKFTDDEEKVFIAGDVSAAPPRFLFLR
jgi:phenol 2-monooxygenase